MENATKALAMAGGVLIAIMILATLLYAANTWGIIPKGQDKNDAVRQLSSFNQRYESFAKHRLYGSDVISVLNMALDNNESYSATQGDTKYIDIQVDITNPIHTIEKDIKHYIEVPEGETTIKAGDTKEETTGGSERLKSGSYHINDFINLKDLLNDKSVQPKGKEKTIRENGYIYQHYKQTVTESSDFRNRIFDCVEIGYNSDGRVNYMHFVEFIPTEE